MPQNKLTRDDVIIKLYQSPIMVKKLSIDQKMKILDDLETPGLSQRKVAIKHGICHRTVQDILHKKDMIRKCESSNPKLRYRVQTPQVYKEVNDAVIRWFEGMRGKHGEVPINEQIICRKALSIAAKLGFKEFKASKGWFCSWKQRYGLRSLKVGEPIHSLSCRYVGKSSVQLWRM